MAINDKDSKRQYKPEFYTIDPEKSAEETLKDITHLVVVAHPDDAEIMAPDLVDLCRKDPTKKLGVIVVTDGQGAELKEDYEDTGLATERTPEQLHAYLAAERKQEQLRAAIKGKYAFLGMLGEPDLYKVPIDMESTIQNIYAIMKQCPKLEQVVTHNPFDNHKHHRAVMSATLTALKMLPREIQNNIQVRGGEVWDEISWIGNKYLRAISLTDEQLKLQIELLGQHRTQVEGSLDYIPAVVGRETSRDIFFRRPWGPAAAPVVNSKMIAVHLSPLIGDDAITLEQYTQDILAEHYTKMMKRIDGMEPVPPAVIPVDSRAQDVFAQRIVMEK